MTLSTRAKESIKTALAMNWDKTFEEEALPVCRN